ncbi:suppressor of IKBKE 1 isoform X1 [Paroedura picta]|uniref:suppressor of IKBKE 1 isoform X1 n=1 Tax=Paroedura picta TaxID=143630 RepID=UPI004056CCCF
MMVIGCPDCALDTEKVQESVEKGVTPAPHSEGKSKPELSVETSRRKLWLVSLLPPVALSDTAPGRRQDGGEAGARDRSSLVMACTIEKILTDARTLLERLKDHDNAAESLIDQSTVLHKRVVAMKEAGTALSHKEDAAELKDTSKYKPHILLSQENTQIRDLQQENRELWVSLEEHQDALELIMSKYRKHMLQLMMKRKDIDTQPVLKVHQIQSAEIVTQIDRIYEMGDVMRKAVEVDDNQYYTVQEKLAQLELENKELRKLLSISSESIEVRQEELPDDASQPTQLPLNT